MKKGSTPGREPRKILKRFTNHGLVVPCDVSILYKLVFNQKKIAELSFHEISRQNKINAQENLKNWLFEVLNIEENTIQNFCIKLGIKL